MDCTFSYALDYCSFCVIGSARGYGWLCGTLCTVNTVGCDTCSLVCLSTMKLNSGIPRAFLFVYLRNAASWPYQTKAPFYRWSRPPPSAAGPGHAQAAAPSAPSTAPRPATPSGASLSSVSGAGRFSSLKVSELSGKRGGKTVWTSSRGYHCVRGSDVPSY